MAQRAPGPEAGWRFYNIRLLDVSDEFSSLVSAWAAFGPGAGLLEQRTKIRLEDGPPVTQEQLKTSIR